MKIDIASPCTESWDRMRGDERVRFCSRCSLNVYNLSGMSEEKVRQLFQQSESRVCVRFFQRKDGTVMTQDCPVGVREKRVAFFSWAAVAGLCLGLVASVAAIVPGSAAPRWVQAVMRWLDPQPRHVVGEAPPVRMGTPAPPPAPPPRVPDEG